MSPRIAVAALLIVLLSMPDTSVATPPKTAVTFHSFALDQRSYLQQIDIATMQLLSSPPPVQVGDNHVSFAVDDGVRFLRDGRWLMFGSVTDLQNHPNLEAVPVACFITPPMSSAKKCIPFVFPDTFLLVSIAAPAITHFQGKAYAFNFALNSTDPDIHQCNPNTAQGQCSVYLLGWSIDDGSLAFGPIHVTDETGEYISNNFISSLADGEVAISSYVPCPEGIISFLARCTLADLRVQLQGCDCDPVGCYFGPSQLFDSSFGTLFTYGFFTETPLPENDYCIAVAVNYTAPDKPICCFRSDLQDINVVQTSFNPTTNWWTLVAIDKSPDFTQMLAYTESIHLPDCQKVKNANITGPLGNMINVVNRFGASFQIL